MNHFKFKKPLFMHKNTAFHSIVFLIITLTLLILTQTHAFSADLAKGNLLYRQGLYIQALKEFRPLAQNRNPDAQFTLGLMYLEGKGVDKNYQSAYDWFNKGANHGHANSLFYLGLMHVWGHSVKVNFYKAKDFFTQAALKGHNDAQADLGMCYYHGKGTPINYKKAFIWFDAAAKMGNDKAAHYLGIMYFLWPGRGERSIQSRKMVSQCCSAGICGIPV